MGYLVKQYFFVLAVVLQQSQHCYYCHSHYFCLLKSLSSECKISVSSSNLPIIRSWLSKLEIYLKTNSRNILSMKQICKHWFKFRTKTRLITSIFSNIHINVLLHMFAEFTRSKEVIFNIFACFYSWIQFSLKIRTKSAINTSNSIFIEFCLEIFN